MKEAILSAVQVVKDLAKILPEIEQAAKMITKSLQAGGKVLICGNGGSAADAQHFAAELVGRFLKERQPYAAIALTTDTSILTAVGNDYGFDAVFERQVQALIKKGDVLIGISTSGKSVNVRRALFQAHLHNAKTILLTGSGEALVDKVTIVLRVASIETPRIQEAHSVVIHGLCQLIEDAMGIQNEG